MDTTNTLLQSIQNNNFLSAKTKSNYISACKKICKMCYEPDLLKIIMNPNTYSNIIISNVATEKAQKHYFTSILSLMNYSNIKNEHKDIYNEWYTHFASVKKKLYLNYLNQKPTEQQVDAHVEWETIIRNRDTMNKSKQDYILMCLITMIPPRRQLDWFNLVIFNKPDPSWRPPSYFQQNFINIGHSTPYMILYNYKTAKFYGSYYKVIPQELLNVLSKAYKHQEQYAFVTSQNKLYSDIIHFSTYTNNVIKKVLDNPKASMNSIRHSYASYMERMHPHMSLYMRKNLARDMGHSLEENMGYANLTGINPS